MSDLAKAVTVTIGLIILAYGVGFAATGANLMWFKFWGPQYADAEREVFEESQSYQHGMIRDLRNLRLEYMRAEPGSSERRVLRSTILHRAAAFDRDDLPTELHNFVHNLESEK